MIFSEKRSGLIHFFNRRSVDCSKPLIFERYCVVIREEVFMERPIEPNMGPSLADVLLCTFKSTNAGFSSFPLRKLRS